MPTPTALNTTPNDHRNRPAPKVPGPKRACVARVLIVEDEPVTAEVFARALERDGHEVRVVSDGMQALHALRDHAPDLVVLDLGLPTLPGIEVLERLRESEHRNLPVVVVSGAAPGRVRSIDDLVTPGIRLMKPLRPRELVAAVRQLAAQ